MYMLRLGGEGGVFGFKYRLNQGYNNYPLLQSKISSKFFSNQIIGVTPIGVTPIGVRVISHKPKKTRGMSHNYIKFILISIEKYQIVSNLSKVQRKDIGS